jgi:hypothetical protein
VTFPSEDPQDAPAAWIWIETAAQVAAEAEERAEAMLALVERALRAQESLALNLAKDRAAFERSAKLLKRTSAALGWSAGLLKGTSADEKA